MEKYFIEISYLLASIFFILGLKGLSHPETAKRGMHLAEFGMLMAIIGTLLHHEIVTYTWILTGLAIGSAVGLAMGLWVPMTAMPQRTALSHAFGAFAAALVGVAEFDKHGGHLDSITMGALGFEVMLGALTTTGSLLAFAKLQGLVRGTPMTYKGQNIFNMALLAVTIGIFVYLVAVGGSAPLFFTMAGLAFVFGLLLVMPIGSADMPVVMSLLNSYAGLASAATGFVLSNKVLIIAGTLDGFSGFILSITDVPRDEPFDYERFVRRVWQCGNRCRRWRATRHDARSRAGRHRHPTSLRKQSGLRAGLRIGDCASATRRARTR